jgi:hypothetical protein
MASQSAGSPESLPPDRPSPARMYDYFLGGFHNFAVDRQAAEQVAALFPDFPLVARANRAFLRRAVRFLIDAGIDQFLDIGSGIPTVVAQSRRLLAGNPYAAVIQADARQADEVLAHPDLARVLDLRRPVAVLLIAFLHFVMDDAQADEIVRAFRGAMAPGSYLALSHGCAPDDFPQDVAQQVGQIYARSTNPAKPRSRDAIRAYFAGLELVPPGVVFAPLWRPEGPDDILFDEPERSGVLAGVGRKPVPKGPGD